MFIGFTIRHFARKALLGSAGLAAVSLMTRSGRRIAKVAMASATGATKAAYAEIKNSSAPPSVVTLKPAIRGHFKTGQRDWPET